MPVPKSRHDSFDSEEWTGVVAEDVAARGEIGPRDTLVCIITGAGFKDVAALERMTAADACPIIDWGDLA